jgi:mRNA interferase MazF
MTYNQFDVVKIPFPFTDKNADKKRPAVIISNPDYRLNNSHYILIMITSAKQSHWVDDINIENLENAGLPVPSKIRFKLFSLDERLVIGKLGRLSREDTTKVSNILSKYLPLKDKAYALA